MSSPRYLPLLIVLPILLLLVPLTLGIQHWSQSEWIENYIFTRRQAYWRAHLDRCSLSGPYTTMTDRLILGDAFNPDFASKKVYLLGGCLMEEVLDTRALGRSRSEIGIYGMPGYNFVDLKELVEWFIQDLAFGKHFDRTHLILVGITMDLTEPPVTPRPADYFLASGLYDYDGGRIRLKPMSNQNRWFIIHRKRMSEFLTSLWRLRPHMIAREIPEGLAPEMDTSQVAEQLKALDGILQILKGTGAKVEAVVTPNAKWLETPGRIQVRNQMIALCQ